MLVGFGLAWTGEQVGLVVGFSSAVLGWIARSQVTPNSRVGELMHPCPGCLRVTSRPGRCVACGGGTTTQRGYGADWQKRRAQQLRGIRRASGDAQRHRRAVVPPRTSTTSCPRSTAGRTTRRILQSLCAAHHRRKTATQDRRWGDGRQSSSRTRTEARPDRLHPRRLGDLDAHLAVEGRARREGHRGIDVGRLDHGVAGDRPGVTGTDRSIGRDDPHPGDRAAGVHDRATDSR